MQEVSDLITAGLGRRFSRIAPQSQSMTLEERLEMAQRKADRYNSERGAMTGYDCPKCLNKGNAMKIVYDERWGMIREGVTECDCMKVRRAIWRMKASGLENSIKRCRFDTFSVSEQWQGDLLRLVKEYAAEPSGWLFVGGQVGCGKTHLCTAACRELLLKGRAVIYMPWQSEIIKLKSLTMDTEEYERALNELKRAEVLYIDDFFKPIQGQEPSAADIRIAYDLINYRYINQMPTLISSEHSALELVQIDEATGSRIYEMSKGHCMGIKRDVARNYRVKELG